MPLTSGLIRVLFSSSVVIVLTLGYIFTSALARNKRRNYSKELKEDIPLLWTVPTSLNTIHAKWLGPYLNNRWNRASPYQLSLASVPGVPRRRTRSQTHTAPRPCLGLPTMEYTSRILWHKSCGNSTNPQFLTPNEWKFTDHLEFVWLLARKFLKVNPKCQHCYVFPAAWHQFSAAVSLPYGSCHWVLFRACGVGKARPRALFTNVVSHKNLKISYHRQYLNIHFQLNGETWFERT